MKEYLAFDIGGTNIKYGIMNENAEIYEKGEFPTPKESMDEFVEALGQIYDRFADRIQEVVVSAPGKIDSGTGYFYTGGSLQYITNMQVSDYMKKRIPVPMAFENDGKAAALAELWKGSMQGISEGIVMTLGTGIGGGIIIDGKLYRGHTFAAGEFSFTSRNLELPFDSKTRNWGQICSVPAMIREFAVKKGFDADSFDGREFFELVNCGDPEAVEQLKAYCLRVASGIYSLQTILDVERVAIGGGISRQPALLKTMNEVMDELKAAQPVRRPMTRPEIVRCTFGNDANMIGALYHYLYELKGGQSK